MIITYYYTDYYIIITYYYRNNGSLLRIITVKMDSLLLIITRSIIRNNRSIITYYWPGNLQMPASRKQWVSESGHNRRQDTSVPFHAPLASLYLIWYGPVAFWFTPQTLLLQPVPLCGQVELTAPPVRKSWPVAQANGSLQRPSSNSASAGSQRHRN